MGKVKSSERHPLLVECEELQTKYLTTGEGRQEYLEADRKCRELGLLPKRSLNRGHSSMNERQFRKRTDEEARARREARLAEKDRQKAISRGRVVWDSSSQGTYNAGRNKAKRERRAMRFGGAWVNPRAMVARPTKPVRPAVNRRRRAMTAKRRAAMRAAQ